MGCWNETCLLTRLPIQSDEDAVCVLIAERPEITSICYAHDVFTPVTLPIFGKYDDYGSLEQLSNDVGSLKAMLRIPVRAKTESGFVPYVTKCDDEREYVARLIRESGHDELYVEMPCMNTHKTAFSRILPVFMLRGFYDFAVKLRRDLFKDVEYKHLYLYDMGLMNSLPVNYAKSLESTRGKQQLARDLIALNSFMGTMRIAWGPTAGSGSQNCLENGYQMDFYDLMRERAQNIHIQSKWD